MYNNSVSNSSKIETHFYGQANVDGDVNFDVRLINNELKITLKYTVNFYNGNFNLDISVPRKTFKTISAKTSSANITLSNNVSTELLNLKTQSGNLEISAAFTNALTTTMSENVLTLNHV